MVYPRGAAGSPLRAILAEANLPAALHTGQTGSQTPMSQRMFQLLLVLAPAIAAAADTEAGRELHQTECIACHQSLMDGDASRIYTRPDHKITSHASLITQVRRCEVNLSLQWFDEDVENVAAYLDETYYHF